MSDLLSLFRLSLHNYFGLTALRIKYLHKREKLWEPVLVLLGVVAGGTSFGSMFYFLALTMARGAAMVGQADFVLTQFIMLAQIMAFTFGLFAMISIFYFSNDLDILVPLPLKAWHILATKFSLVNIVEYAPVIVILMPTLIAYNQVVTLGLGGWFTAAAEAERHLLSVGDEGGHQYYDDRSILDDVDEREFRGENLPGLEGERY